MTELRIDRSSGPPDRVDRDRRRASEFEITISIEGPAVQDGQIAAAVFGSALVPLSRLIERVSEIATGTRLSPRIRDQFERGSFIFTITPPHNLVEAIQWLTTTKVLLDLIGIPTGKDGGLRAVIKRWREAKLPDKAKVFDQPPLTADAVAIAAQDPDAIRYAADFAKLLRSPGIDEVRFSTDDSVQGVLDKQDARALDALRKLAPSTRLAVAASEARLALPPAEENIEGVFEIVSAGLTADAQWVLRSADEGTFEAHMHDHVFRDRVLERRVTFGRGDRIRAVLSSIRWAGTRRPGLSRRITNVLTFLPASSVAPDA